MLETSQFSFAAVTEQVLIEAPKRPMRFVFRQRVIQLRCRESRLGLRIRYTALPSERCEFTFPPTADGFAQVFVSVAGEILKRSSLAVFFAHEQHGNEWG